MGGCELGLRSCGGVLGDLVRIVSVIGMLKELKKSDKDSVPSGTVAK